MLAITGYADRWSVRPGETIRFMISVQGGGRYRARVARVICGDPNPAGPGYREIPVPWTMEGEHDGQQQDIQLGSWAAVPDVTLPDLTLANGMLGFAATVWPTRLAADDQAVLSWAGAAGSITLGIGPAGATCRLVTSSGTQVLRTGMPLTERAWHDIACVFDPKAGVLHLGQAPHRPRLDRVEAATCHAIAPGGLAGLGAACIAAEQAAGRATRHYNGKIERPCMSVGAPDLGALLRAQRTGVACPTETPLAAWNFSRAMQGDTVEDWSGQERHGVLMNLPTRAMTGSNWDGTVHRWTDDPAQYGAIHFHDDDLGDAGWRPSLDLVVPGNWISGVYALHLETPAGRDNIVFYVRAAVPGMQAKVAFLAPTFSYTVYGQFQKAGRQALITERSNEWGALAQAPDGHPEYGVSPYNLHSDGSGVVMSTMRRPLIDKRVNQIHLVDPSEGGSGVYWIAADSYLTDLLTREGIAFEVITDHDLHAEGVGLLSRYQVILTGQHPEYHTVETLDALSAFLEGGGRLMYLGGNGFYWKVVPHADGPWSFELRRAEGGIRLWEALPGEGHHAHDGSYGGLWRRLGRAPQALVGVGFSTQGD